MALKFAGSALKTPGPASGVKVHGFGDMCAICYSPVRNSAIHIHWKPHTQPPQLTQQSTQCWQQCWQHCWHNGSHSHTHSPVTTHASTTLALTNHHTRTAAGHTHTHIHWQPHTQLAARRTLDCADPQPFHPNHQQLDREHRRRLGEWGEDEEVEDPKRVLFTTECMHVFHKCCLVRCREADFSTCPMCRAALPAAGTDG